jgi:hypothetical protein
MSAETVRQRVLVRHDLKGTAVFIVKAAAIAAVLVSMSSGPASAHAVGVDFDAVTVFAMGPTHNYVAEYDGTPGQWTIIGGPASDLYAGSAGVFAVSPTTGDIAQYDGTPGEWTVIGGPGTEFTEAGDHLYGLGPNDAYVAEYDGTPGQWTVIGGPADEISGGADGLFAVSYNATEDVLKYNGTPGDWTDIGFGPALEIAVGRNAVYALTRNGVNVDMWTSATGWVRIGPSTPVQNVDDLVAGGGGVAMNDVNTQQMLEYNGTPDSWSVINTGLTLSPQAVSSDYIYALNSADGTTAVEVYSGSGTQWTVIGGAASAPLAAGD